MKFWHFHVACILSTKMFKPYFAEWIMVNDGIDMDDEPKAPKSEKEVADCTAKNISIAEKTVGTEQDKGIGQYADAPAERVSLKAKLEVMKGKVAGGDTEKPMPQKARGKEETL